MFKPILITTPRTGSSLICQLLGDIARQTSDYKNDLQEFYTIEPGYEAIYEQASVFNEQIITVKPYREVGTHPLWYGSEDNKRQMTLDRTEMLVSNQYRYMIKLFAATLLNDDIQKAVFPRYDPVYLQRHDLLQQYLSSMYLQGPNLQFHYQSGQTAKAKEIQFNYKHFINFKNTLLVYNNVKKRYPGPTIFYEDVVQHKNQHQALADVLGVSCECVTPSVVKTIESPYAIPLKEMLVRDWKWDMYKNEVEDFFSLFNESL
jgi:hypothetical protein